MSLIKHSVSALVGSHFNLAPKFYFRIKESISKPWGAALFTRSRTKGLPDTALH